VERSMWVSLSAFLPFIKPRNVIRTSSKSATSSFDYLEEIATVTDTIRPYRPGRIFFKGTWWNAVCEQNVELSTGSTVCVVGRTNITCIVQPFVV
jgi:membrane protein implicated in regulation of membrane protease activity